ncbi:hypothetical protein Tco_0965995 [Tanacetum coccineum]
MMTIPGLLKVEGGTVKFIEVSGGVTEDEKLYAKSHVPWVEIGESSLTGLELVQEMTDKMRDRNLEAAFCSYSGDYKIDLLFIAFLKLVALEKSASIEKSFNPVLWFRRVTFGYPWPVSGEVLWPRQELLAISGVSIAGLEGNHMDFERIIKRKLKEKREQGRSEDSEERESAEGKGHKEMTSVQEAGSEPHRRRTKPKSEQNSVQNHDKEKRKDKDNVKMEAQSISKPEPPDTSQ